MAFRDFSTFATAENQSEDKKDQPEDIDGDRDNRENLAFPCALVRLAQGNEAED